MISSGVKPCLYHPTIRRTVTPVPAIRGRPPRILSERTINEPMSVTVVIVTSHPLVLQLCYRAAGNGLPAQRGERAAGEAGPCRRTLSHKYCPAHFLPHCPDGLRTKFPGLVLSMAVLPASISTASSFVEFRRAISSYMWRRFWLTSLTKAWTSADAPGCTTPK